ncbi:MAG: hypothetical protein BRD47_05610, partial [Bacteroidetes bacterium QS_8_68_28]
PNLLQRATWTLAALFIALCILTNFAIDRDGEETAPSTLQDSAQPQQQGPAPQQRPTPGSQQAPGGQQQTPPPAGGGQQSPSPQQGGGGQ